MTKQYHVTRIGLITYLEHSTQTIEYRKVSFICDTKTEQLWKDVIASCHKCDEVDFLTESLKKVPNK